MPPTVLSSVAIALPARTLRVTVTPLAPRVTLTIAGAVLGSLVGAEALTNVPPGPKATSS